MMMVIMKVFMLTSIETKASTSARRHGNLMMLQSVLHSVASNRSSVTISIIPLTGI